MFMRKFEHIERTVVVAVAVLFVLALTGYLHFRMPPQDMWLFGDSMASLCPFAYPRVSSCSWTTEQLLTVVKYLPDDGSVKRVIVMTGTNDKAAGVSDGVLDLRMDMLVKRLSVRCPDAQITIISPHVFESLPPHLKLTGDSHPNRRGYTEIFRRFNLPTAF